MELPLVFGKPILVPRVRVTGPKAIREVDLFLDTGALYTLLAVDVLREVGCDPLAARRRIPMVTAKGVLTVPVVRVPSVEVAGFRLRNVSVLCHDIPELAEAAGLLGLNVLESFITTLDYEKRKLLFQLWR